MRKNKFSLGKETPCRGFHNYATLRRSRFFLRLFLLLQTFLFLIFLTPLLKLRHFFLIVEKLGDDRLIHTHDLQNFVLGDLGSTAVTANLVIKDKTRFNLIIQQRKRMLNTFRQKASAFSFLGYLNEAAPCVFKVSGDYFLYQYLSLLS